MSPHQPFLQDAGHEYLEHALGPWWVECACGWVSRECSQRAVAVALHREHLDYLRSGPAEVQP